MLSGSANTFGNPGYPTRNTSRARSRSRERRPTNPEDQTKGYGCTVFKDYLLLLGPKAEENGYRGGSFLCVYNLKERRPEEVQRGEIPLQIGSCTACFYPRVNAVIFYGIMEGRAGMGTGSRAQRCMALAFVIHKYGEGIFLLFLGICES